MTLFDGDFGFDGVRGKLVVGYSICSTRVQNWRSMVRSLPGKWNERALDSQGQYHLPIQPFFLEKVGVNCRNDGLKFSKFGSRSSLDILYRQPLRNLSCRIVD